MYGIFTCIWLIFMVNVGKYTIPMDCLGKTSSPGQSIANRRRFRPIAPDDHRALNCIIRGLRDESIYVRQAALEVMP